MATRDIQKFTEKEHEKMVSVFRSLPSYDDSGDEPRVSPDDIPLMFKGLAVERTPAQLNGYKDYVNNQLGGYITLSKYMSGFSAMYKASKFSKFLAEPYDRNGDGFISAQEFHDFLSVVELHEPKLKGLAYSEFVKAADTDKDGKVSVKEFANWIRETMNEYDSC